MLRAEVAEMGVKDGVFRPEPEGKDFVSLLALYPAEERYSAVKLAAFLLLPVPTLPTLRVLLSLFFRSISLEELNRLCASRTVQEQGTIVMGKGSGKN